MQRFRNWTGVYMYLFHHSYLSLTSFVDYNQTPVIETKTRALNKKKENGFKMRNLSFSRRYLSKDY